MLTNIAISKLRPHPQNPRRELGDLAELAESIKARGVLQNLTVIPIDAANANTDYTVVIGHRRLAAGQLAGLTEMPCIIEDMDEKTQIATMLLENIQRNDLTAYEQAQGFQLMLDLGETVSDISKQTGFSHSTVSRRIKLLELDKDKFARSVERGATFTDFAELDKIQSLERKNAVLDKIGTANFQYELKRAIDAEAQEVRTAAWIEALSAFATQVDSSDGYRNVRHYYTSSEPKVERPEDADTTEYFFYVSKYGYIYLMKNDDGQAKKEDPEAACRRERLEYRRSELARATERAHILRKEFIQGVSTSRAKKHMADVIAFAVMGKIEAYVDMDEDLLLELLGVEKNEDNEVPYDTVSETVSKSPERALLLMVYCESGDGKKEGYFAYYNAEHQGNEELDRLYGLLEKLGYAISDEEKALMDGSHEFYDEAVPGDKDDCEGEDDHEDEDE